MVGSFVAPHVLERYVSGALGERLAAKGWQVTFTSRMRARLPRVLDMLRTTFRSRSRYDVAQVEVYSGSAFIWAELVCALLKRLEKPVILSLHGGSLPAFARAHPSRVRKLLACARHVTSPSGYLAEAIGAYGVPVRVVPNPIEIGRYPWRRRERPEPKLVWLRAFHRTYDPEAMPRVMADLAVDVPDAEVTMIGPDKDGSLSRTRSLADKLSVGSRMHFPGAVAKQDVVGWLDRADVFVNSTTQDNTPVSVLEAMACGLPVVSTNVGGLPWLLEDGVSGLLVPPRRPDLLANAIRRVLREDGLAARLSEGARRRAGECDWSRVLPAWETLLREAAMGGRAAGTGRGRPRCAEAACAAVSTK